MVPISTNEPTRARERWSRRRRRHEAVRRPHCPGGRPGSTRTTPGARVAVVEVVRGGEGGTLWARHCTVGRTCIDTVRDRRWGPSRSSRRAARAIGGSGSTRPSARDRCQVQRRDRGFPSTHDVCLREVQRPHQVEHVLCVGPVVVQVGIDPPGHGLGVTRRQCLVQPCERRRIVGRCGQCRVWAAA